MGQLPRSAWFVSFAFLLLALSSGCGPKEEPHPPVFPVTGKVIAASGEPFSGGMIEFRSLENEEWIATGRIGPAGEFVLGSFAGNKRVEGTIAGRYRVVVTPPLPQTAAVQAIVEPISVTENYTVTADASNNFTISLK